MASILAKVWWITFQYGMFMGHVTSQILMHMYIINAHVYSMIEMMEDYTAELEGRLARKNRSVVKPAAYSTALNLDPAVDRAPRGELANVTHRKMAVMVCVDSTTAESARDWSLVDVVTEAAVSVVGDVFIAKQARNSIIIAIDPNAGTSTVTPVAQLLAIAGEVVTKVRTTIQIAIHY